MYIYLHLPNNSTIHVGKYTMYPWIICVFSTNMGHGPSEVTSWVSPTDQLRHTAFALVKAIDHELLQISDEAEGQNFQF